MSEEEIEFRWNVTNVDLLWKGEISNMSPTFQEEKIGNTHRFRLILTRIVKSEKKEESIEELEKATETGYISLYLQNLFFKECHHKCGPIWNVAFSLCHPMLGEILRQSKIQFDARFENLFGIEKFISMEQLKEYSLDKFTIICKLKELEQESKTYAQYFNQNTCSDFKLIFGLDKTQIFPAHKLVLALGSYYFRDKFAKKNPVSCFEMINIRTEVAIEILRYIYTGEAIYTESLAYELFEASLYFKVRGLRFKCQKILVQNLKLLNVVRTLLACRGNLFYNALYIRELLLKCMSLISEHLDVVVRLDLCKELLEKAPEILTEIVAHLSTTNAVPKTYIEDESFACSQSLKKMFERFAKSFDYSDIEIHVNDIKYPAHKLILAARSPVFDRMLSHNMNKAISDVVTIEDVRPQVFEMVLKFIYTDEIESDDLVQELLIASDKYEISDLKWKYENILEDNLTADNVVATLIFSAEQNADRLKQKCIGFMTHSDSPFWSQRENHFETPKSILNENLAKSHPHLLYEMLKEIQRRRVS